MFIVCNEALCNFNKFSCRNVSRVSRVMFSTYRVHVFKMQCRLLSAANFVMCVASNGVHIVMS